MTILHYYDIYGWYTPAEIPDRSTELGPSSVPAERVVGEPWPNWTGDEWAMLIYVEPAPLDAPEAPEPEWAWYLDLGPFSDRLGPAASAIDLSTAPGLVAIRSDFARRKWIDLKDPRVIAAVMYLAGQPHPVLGTLAEPLISGATAAAAVTTRPAPGENLALRKLYFS